MTDFHGSPEGLASALKAPPGDAPRRTNTLGLVLLIAGMGALTWWRPFLAIVVAAIIVMIFLHELGHYLTARAAGINVTEFFIGFGPRLWSFRRGETEYGVKPIPAGAYVKVVGMHNLEDVDPADEPRTYRQKPFWRRLSVAVAGSGMHFLLVLVCIYLLLAVVGTPDGRIVPDPERAENVNTISDWVVGDVSDDSAADRAGVEVGDHIVSVDGEAVNSFEELRDVVEPRANERVDIVIERDDRRLTLETTLGSREDEDEGEIGFFGIGPNLPTRTVGPVDAAGRTFVEFGRLTELTVVSLGQFFSPSGLTGFFGDAADEAGGEPSTDGGSGNPNRVVSILGAALIGEQLTQAGFGTFLQFFVVLNVFVGIFNLVPLLPLDGGHVAIAVYERIRSRKGKRYHADVAKMLPVAYAVVVILVLVGITALYLDIVNPLTLPD
ncbi:MAG: M50 family metallopeptidase [Acidimicrobiales bacterium]